MLLGDSHLARLRRELTSFPGEVRSAAEDGASSRDQVNGHVVRTDLLLAPLGAKAFAGDGMHLNGAGYRVLVPAIASACESLP